MTTENNEPVSIPLCEITLKASMNWGQRKCGFGQLAMFVEQSEGVTRLSGDTEGMSKEWVRKALHTMVDSIADALPEGRAIVDLSKGFEVPVPEHVIEHRRKFENLFGEGGTDT